MVKVGNDIPSDILWLCDCPRSSRLYIRCTCSKFIHIYTPSVGSGYLHPELYFVLLRGILYICSIISYLIEQVLPKLWKARTNTPSFMPHSLFCRASVSKFTLIYGTPRFSKAGTYIRYTTPRSIPSYCMSNVRQKGERHIGGHATTRSAQPVAPM